MLAQRRTSIRATCCDDRHNLWYAVVWGGVVRVAHCGVYACGVNHHGVNLLEAQPTALPVCGCLHHRLCTVVAPFTTVVV
jgi:hypothetical protein